MAATSVIARSLIKSGLGHKKIIGEKISVTCTAHTDGTFANATLSLNGFLVRLTTNPGATAPQDNYDITLTDADGLDVVESLALNRDTANSEGVYIVATGAPTPPLLTGDHTLALANNNVNGAITVVNLYIYNGVNA